VTVEGTEPAHLTAVLDALAAAGFDVARAGKDITLSAPRRAKPLAIVARPYPGIPTDLQAQFMALAMLAEGRSSIGDEVFPDRFMHVAELNRLGARIERRGAMAVVSGVERLSGAMVMACDLRAGAALVLAALASEGPSTVRRVYHLDRGYERLELKLARLGAAIRREADDPISWAAALDEPVSQPTPEGYPTTFQPSTSKA
jgi:UDP-N-acetylglucosamine 1-carboxyvinyltransferase